MAVKSPPLPEPLQYLQSFVRSLAKLPPEDLNEDVDPSRLESALRKRLGGLGEQAAAEALEADRALLEQWLKTSAPPDHPAYWVLGFLSLPDLAQQLARPDLAGQFARRPEPAPRGPTMTLEPPDGWKVKPLPFRLDLKKGKLIGTIVVIDKFGFDVVQRQKEQWKAPPGVALTLSVAPIQAGAVSGRKYTFRQAESAPWKHVEYVLRVPGGDTWR